MVSFPRIPTQSCTSSARSLSASKSQDLPADRERAERKKQKKQSYDHCNTQQLEGETHGKSERVTSVSRVTQLVPARANKERTESKSRRNASLITSEKGSREYVLNRAKCRTIVIFNKLKFAKRVVSDSKRIR